MIGWDETYFVCFIAKEVDFLELLVLDKLEGIRLVPSIGEYIEGYLATNRECQAIVGEFLS